MFAARMETCRDIADVGERDASRYGLPDVDRLLQNGVRDLLLDCICACWRKDWFAEAGSKYIPSTYENIRDVSTFRIFPNYRVLLRSSL